MKKKYLIITLCTIPIVIIIAGIYPQYDSRYLCVKKNIINRKYTLDSVFSQLTYYGLANYGYYERLGSPKAKPATLTVQCQVLSNYQEYIVTIKATKLHSGGNWLVSSVLIHKAQHNPIYLFVIKKDLVYEQHFDLTQSRILLECHY